MHPTYLRSVATLLALSWSAALVVPNASTVRSHSNVGHASFLNPATGIARSYSVALQLQKGKKKALSVDETKEGIDYGKVMLLFVDPRNPYSWFLYMLGFITIYGTLTGN
jgi:hypothetical protein